MNRRTNRYTRFYQPWPLRRFFRMGDTDKGWSDNNPLSVVEYNYKYSQCFVLSLKSRSGLVRLLHRKSLSISAMIIYTYLGDEQSGVKCQLHRFCWDVCMSHSVRTLVPHLRIHRLRKFFSKQKQISGESQGPTMPSHPCRQPTLGP